MLHLSKDPLRQPRRHADQKSKGPRGSCPRRPVWERGCLGAARYSSAPEPSIPGARPSMGRGAQVAEGRAFKDWRAAQSHNANESKAAQRPFVTNASTSRSQRARCRGGPHTPRDPCWDRAVRASEALACSWTARFGSLGGLVAGSARAAGGSLKDHMAVRSHDADEPRYEAKTICDTTSPSSSRCGESSVPPSHGAVPGVHHRGAATASPTQFFPIRGAQGHPGRGSQVV